MAEREEVARVEEADDKYMAEAGYFFASNPDQQRRAERRVARGEWAQVQVLKPGVHELDGFYVLAGTRRIPQSLQRLANISCAIADEGKP
jgi:hypothetical protein